MLNKARLIKAESAAAAKPVDTARESARIIPRAVVDAHAAASQIRSRAQAEAQAQLASLDAEKERILREAREQGYAEGITEASARCIALAKQEASKDARELDRSVELARLLAERLLGHALQNEPELVVQLARQALSEVRGASRIRMDVSAADEPVLTEQLRALDVSGAALELRVDPALNSGDFRLSTNIGSLEASLGTRLQRLCEKLREGLRP